MHLGEKFLDFLLAPLSASEIKQAYSLIPESLKGSNISTVSVRNEPVSIEELT